MSAERLREAAALMRERATAARAGRWGRTESTLDPLGMHVVANWKHGPVGVAICSGALPEGNEANAEHIASWHPAVALALADWLDFEADCFRPGSVRSDKALAVANAYLGDGA